MLPTYNPVPRFPGNSKAGLTIHLDHKDDGEPFEATVFFKKSGKSPEEPQARNAINLIASGRPDPASTIAQLGCPGQRLGSRVLPHRRSRKPPHPLRQKSGPGSLLRFSTKE